MSYGSRSSTPVRGLGIYQRKHKTNIIIVMMVTLSSMIFVGIIFTISMAPSETVKQSGGGGGGGPSATNSMIQSARTEVSLISHKIIEWLPHHSHAGLPASMREELPPDWSKEFWTPIDFDLSYLADPTVLLCKLNFKQYSSSPNSYPMFRDLEGISKCQGSNRRREYLSVLMKELKKNEGTPEGRVVAPTAFVFHESRVGSTLVANSLAADPWSLVFSESAPAANALLHCTGGCSREKSIQLFRDIVTLMGRSPFHKRLFFKFQSITSTKMDIVLAAFPDTPWSFVYRQPVQTMMSHLDPLKSSTGAPCLRSMRDPPQEVRETLSTAVGIASPPKEAWCAAHLNMLCSNAIRAYEKHGTIKLDDGSIVQRGFLINYESLPGIIPRVLFPLFAVEPNERWLEMMRSTSTQYSKGRGGKASVFTGDSEDKEQRATNSIQKYAKDILQPSFDKLLKYTADSLQKSLPDTFSSMSTKADGALDWSSLKSIPSKASPVAQTYFERNRVPAAAEEASRDGSSEALSSLARSPGEKHSDIGDRFRRAYQPWVPFSNTHPSKPFDAIECPDVPAHGYPRAYSMVDMTNNWNTDSTEIPAQHYDSLCHFDYQNATELSRAHAYRVAEVPFIVYNIPEVDSVAKKWNDVDYLHKKLGSKTYRTETSEDNHFMYWHNKQTNYLRNGKKWTPPTGLTQITFEKWLEMAVRGQNKTLEDRKHQYFRVSSDMGNSWLFDELPFFKPEPSLFIVEPKEQRGIHCRFGMRSVIAEAHFDGSRNAVVMLGGMRRWILTHPNQCVNMHMLPKDHPSGRHSDIDWSKPDTKQFPNFVKIMGNEVILQPGDFLYVPTYWIHYIVSLNVNFQCNTRSGKTSHYDKDIRKCGF